MKKIKIFLISLTLLTFSNTVSAGFFGDIFEVVFGKSDEETGEEPWIKGHGSIDEVRCKVEYAQLDLTTGLEENVKHTAQYDLGDLAGDYNSGGITGNEYVLYLAAQDLTDKINIWLNENPNNVITNLTIINCKERRPYFSKFFLWHNENRWSEYKGCPDEHNIKLIDFLDKPEQWGYNVNKERLIKEYEDGCKDYKRESLFDRE
jgi:hypothetical protein